MRGLALRPAPAEGVQRFERLDAPTVPAQIWLCLCQPHGASGRSSGSRLLSGATRTVTSCGLSGVGGVLEIDALDGEDGVGREEPLVLGGVVVRLEVLQRAVVPVDEVDVIAAERRIEEEGPPHRVGPAGNPHKLGRLGSTAWRCRRSVCSSSCGVRSVTRLLARKSG